MKYVLYAFLIYLAYQLVFNLAIPVYRTSRRIKKAFREMNEKMNAGQQNGTTPEFATSPSSQPQKRNSNPEDYIDFEEIK